MKYYLAIFFKLSSYEKTQRKQTYIRERNQSEKDTYRMIPTVSRKDSKRSMVARGQGVRGDEQMVTKGSETRPHDTIMVNTCHYKFSRTYRMYTNNEF